MSQQSTQLAEHPDSLEILSDLDELGRIREFLRDCACRAGVISDEQELWNFEIAVTEVVSNVIQHGYSGAEDQPIRFEAAVEDEQFVFRVFHQGAAYTPPTEIPELTEPTEGGMGLFIISKCVDEVSYTESPDGHPCIQLKQSLRKELAHGKHN